jgi:uncharacterized coiled-coil protein SlyX
MTSIDRMSVERLAEYISPDVRRVMLAQAARIEELEAKLAKALRTIEKMQDASDAMMLYIARTTLAELEQKQ